MSDLIGILDQLKGWGPLSTCLGLFIIALYREVLCWGRELRKSEARLLKVEAERDEWKETAFALIGPLQDAVAMRRKVRDVS